MASPDSTTDRSDKRRDSRISLQTLIIASVASAAAAYAASRIWGTGTLISAAATPVVVALVSEFLRRPVQTVASTAKKIPTVHTLPAARQRTIVTPEDPTNALQDRGSVTTNPPDPLEPQSPVQPHPRRRVEPPVDSTPAADPGATQAAANAWRPRWRLAVITGLLAFGVVVALYTVPDLLAGHSVTGNGQPTTFFGASRSDKKKISPTTTVTTTTSPTTVTETVPATSTTTATPTTKSTTTPTSPTSTQTPSPTSPTVNPTTTPTSPGP